MLEGLCNVCQDLPVWYLLAAILRAICDDFRESRQFFSPSAQDFQVCLRRESCRRYVIEDLVAATLLEISSPLRY